MTAVTFMRCFKRFAARRGIPLRMISDNGKTFKSASRIIKKSLESPEVRKYFDQLHVKWEFNLEKAPWWGGIFERMIKSAKRCLRKAIGRNCLTYDELLTLVTEVEAVLNSRPLTYVSSEDLEEPLTPSHLLVGYRIMTLPNPSVSDDSDYPDSARDLSHRMSHLTRVLQKFWKRWKKEYLSELREFHRIRIKSGTVHTVERGEVVTAYDEGHPRGLWRLGRVEDLIQGSDGKVRGVYVRVSSKGGRVRVLRRPVQHIYPLEVQSEPSDGEPTNTDPPYMQMESPCNSAESVGTTPDHASMCRPVRASAVQARDRILGCVTD